MRFAYTRLVTDDVPQLAAFYAKLLGTEPQGSGDYVELRPGGANSRDRQPAGGGADARRHMAGGIQPIGDTGVRGR